MQQSPYASSASHRQSPSRDSDATLYPPSQASSMTLTSEEAGTRSSHGSGRSTHSRRVQNPQQQLSQIEKSVTHLLVATKQLLETLTLWSRGTATESEVSDVYVRLGYEFNIASRAFNAIGVDTQDLGNVPELLRGILEETLSQEASQASLDNFLPRIRDIIINLLHGLKKKQQRLRQRSGRDGIPNGTSPRQGSVGSTSEIEEPQSRASSTRLPPRQDSSDYVTDGPDLPPRSSSVPGRSSPNKYDANPSNPRANRGTAGSQLSTDSSLSSNTMQQIPVIAPYPPDDTMPTSPDPRAPPAYNVSDFPPPPPPPKQQDALAALQRGGELERRASRRFSAYQIQKHLGTNGIPLPPTQNSPIPNRGRDARESMNAVRIRGSLLHSRQRSAQKLPIDTSYEKGTDVSRRISEESSQGSAPSIKPPREPLPEDSPVQKTPEDKLGPSRFLESDRPLVGATLSGPLSEPVELPADSPTKDQKPASIPARNGSRRVKSPSPQPDQFIPEQSPQPGKELTLFLQYRSKIKKYVFADGSDLSAGRLQLAFIEKFAWDTHRNGELPEIYIQDPVSGVRHELEDINDIKDRSVLVLNVEQLDEVKHHIDDKFGGLSRLVESIKTVVTDQQSAIQRVAERQQQAAKEIAGIAAAPAVSSARVSTVLTPRSPMPSNGSSDVSISSAAQLSEVQSLRRDLAVVRQTYSSFASDIEASMSAIRTKAAAVKSTAIKVSLPALTGDSGRSYVNAGKKTLQDDSEKIVTRVDDLQDVVEDLRKDVVSRGVRPLPRQLETTAKDLSIATAELKKLQDFLAKEKPLWTKIWEQELQTVCEERDLLTMQEELAADLRDDLEKAAQTLELVEQATKQQNLQTDEKQGTARSASGRNLLHAVAYDKAVDPRQARDGVLGEVKALQPNHEGRLEAIERAEKARQRELEERREGEFKKELGSFVEEGKLKKSGGVEEAERLRKAKDERARKENWERQNARAKAAAAVAASTENGAEERKDGENKAVGAPPTNGEEANEAKAQAPEDMPIRTYSVRPWVRVGIPPLPISPVPSLVDISPNDLSQSAPSSTIRLVEPTPAPESPTPLQNPTYMSGTPTSEATSPPTAKPTSTTIVPERRTPRSSFFGPRDKDKASPKTPPTVRPRGKTVPMAVPSTPERADTASLHSFTPSTSSKHISSWFSGLLGR
ncbi:AIP3-domain-containing protein [Lindgomyces ingoldianus]|uniref:AIP3-domain-containing protein n=1 Tax=Lindgomyces ingoldianus TaxID=673940 RepID=A0ACB6QZE1_9PLEO|nr:AIP3-domain-containing protein [Lindgomyces ingoldianus]KAF2471642.1 AIP3-domain-containing protein [Lindgomyces ingoldianus]